MAYILYDYTQQSKKTIRQFRWLFPKKKEIADG